MGNDKFGEIPLRVIVSSTIAQWSVYDREMLALCKMLKCSLSDRCITPVVSTMGVRAVSTTRTKDGQQDSNWKLKFGLGTDDGEEEYRVNMCGITRELRKKVQMSSMSR